MSQEITGAMDERRWRGPFRAGRPLLVPHYIVFDLDETLYPRQSGVMQEIGRRITLYLEEFLKLPEADALALRSEYFRKHGTTLRGLQIYHRIDPDHYMTYVHDVPIENMLVYDPRLDAALEEIDAEKVIFTNASREHAERVLKVRGIARHFSRIIDVRDMGWESKPTPSAYPRLLDVLGTPAERCMLVEDNVRNLRPAAEIGMLTVLVDGNEDTAGAVDFTLHETWEIGQVYALLQAANAPAPGAAKLASKSVD